MTQKKLRNYLKTSRKRTGLSQSDVAFLLGSKSRAKVSRDERLVRKPTLENALAYEVLFGTPVRELFPGIYSDIEGQIIDHASKLRLALQNRMADPLTARKLEFLRMVLVAPDIIAENE